MERKPIGLNDTFLEAFFETVEFVAACDGFDYQTAWIVAIACGIVED